MAQILPFANIKAAPVAPAPFVAAVDEPEHDPASELLRIVLLELECERLCRAFRQYEDSLAIRSADRQAAALARLRKRVDMLSNVLRPLPQPPRGAA